MHDEIASILNSQAQTCHLLFTVATSNKAQLFPRVARLLDLWPHDRAGGDTAAGSMDCLPANTQKGE